MSDPGDEMFDHADYPPRFAQWRPPEGSNADEWHMYLSENKDALGMVAVGIAEAIEAAEARIWTEFVKVCEALETEAEDKFKDGPIGQQLPFYRGQKFTAKSIRCAIDHPKYARRVR